VLTGRAPSPGDGVFVHHSAVKGGGFRGLQANQRVEFTLGSGVKGPQAEDVHAI
jgi:CspA family cold shock protein